MATDYAVILGYVLFGLSEIIALLPVPANGIAQSLVIGLRNSLSNPNTDVELARKIIGKNPEVATTINQVTSIPELQTAMDTLSKFPQLIQQIDILKNSTQIQYIVTILNAHPELVQDASRAIESQLLSAITVVESNNS
jgi:hypothetical protein